MASESRGVSTARKNPVLHAVDCRRSHTSYYGTQHAHMALTEVVRMRAALRFVLPCSLIITPLCVSPPRLARRAVTPLHVYAGLVICAQKRPVAPFHSSAVAHAWTSGGGLRETRGARGHVGLLPQPHPRRVSEGGGPCTRVNQVK